jgi:hypothetical protein
VSLIDLGIIEPGTDLTESAKGSLWSQMRKKGAKAKEQVEILPRF